MRGRENEGRRKWREGRKRECGWELTGWANGQRVLAFKDPLYYDMVPPLHLPMTGAPWFPKRAEPHSSMGGEDGLSRVWGSLLPLGRPLACFLGSPYFLPPLSLQTEVLAPFPWPVAGLAADRPPGPGFLSSRTSPPCLSPNSQDSLFHLAGWIVAQLGL